jgi:hypothetical protein
MAVTLFYKTGTQVERGFIETNGFRPKIYLKKYGI